MHMIVFVPPPYETVGSMPRNLPPLTALRAFDAVARLGSLRSAAENLSIHHTVVGRHVRKLENWLGVKLLDSNFAETRLTDAGKEYHERIAVAFDHIDDATFMLRPSGHQQLKVWCGPGLNKSWLMPRIEEINRAARVDVVLLRATDHLPDFRRFEADVAVHYGREYIAYSNSVELYRPRHIAVASRDFLERHPVAEPRDLLSVPLLHEQTTDAWVRWLHANGVKAPSTLGGQKLGYAHIVIEAAAIGQGVALANEILVAPEIGQGRLVEAVATETYLDSYYFYASKSRWNEPAIARLRQYLVDNLGA
ncbi:LacI family transcriptional regulator protein (plasmid) [Rhizobium sp. N541]|nr:LacI family transcriptional regulator protein [Rhizobium sp. N324]ANM20602.1 LacI family transcriptional regulator protein [Rhizobium sp. N541]ANM26986.1 LacI family transcriptional regulator protein [Rhizobium sp. N941]OYD00391.1 LacI family transcriptional regulator protein [Rhizobium sp. N4311]